MLSSNNYKKMLSIDSIEKYSYGTSKDLVRENEEIKCNNIMKTIQKMIKFDDVLNEKLKEHNPN